MTDPVSDPPARGGRGPRWTPRRQVAFLEALRDGASVRAAAAGVGMSRQSAYNLRRRLAGTAFDRAWAMVEEERSVHEAFAPFGSTACPLCGRPAGWRPPAQRGWR